MKKAILIFLISFALMTNVNAATGTIDSVSHTARVCHDVSCTTPVPGSINFAPTTGASVVVDSITGISGQIWGNELGWINLQPTGAGITFANPTTGLLTGKAWSQVSGWINFAPTGQQVVINPANGEFSGFAWTGGPYGGWVEFNCGNVASCVKTTWPGVTSPPPIYPTRGSVPLDVCPNIVGIQSSIPNSYTVNNFGQCIITIDVCPNLIGEQANIPKNYIIDEIGACISNEVDYCFNIPGNQYIIPNGFVVDDQGECVAPSTDVCPNDPGNQISYSQCSKKQIQKDACPNLPGIQNALPKDHVYSEGSCYLQTFDLCPNIPESQSVIPIDYMISEDGSCIVKPDDLCANLGGSQVIVPKGYTKEGDNCFYIPIKEQNNDEQKASIKVIALPFISSSSMVTSDNKIIKSSVEFIDRKLGTNFTETPYQVDLVSFNIVLFSILVFLGGIAFLVRKMIFLLIR